jgi:hypothetical protein
VHSELSKLQQSSAEAIPKDFLLADQAVLLSKNSNEAKVEAKVESEDDLSDIEVEIKEHHTKAKLITKCPHTARKHYAKVRFSLLNIEEHVLQLLQKVR